LPSQPFVLVCCACLPGLLLVRVLCFWCVSCREGTSGSSGGGATGLRSRVMRCPAPWARYVQLRVTSYVPPKGGPVSQANLCPRLSRRGLEHSHCGAGSRTRRADTLQRPSSEQRCILHGEAVRVQVMAYIRTAPSPHPSASDPAIRTSRLPGRISHPRRSTPQKPPSVSLPSRQE